MRDPSPPIDPAPPSRPFHPDPYPAVKPFSSLKPGSSNSPSPLPPGVQYLACSRLHHPCDVSLHPRPHGVQPCCLPLMAKILEGDISSPLFLLLTCSFIQQVFILSLSALGRAGSTVNKTMWPCSHEAYNQVGKRGINHYQVLREGLPQPNSTDQFLSALTHLQTSALLLGHSSQATSSVLPSPHCT